jgi:hypothetical protein
MIVQNAQGRQRAARNSPLRTYQIMGNHVATDFALRDLPPGIDARTTTTVLSTTRAFPPVGDLVREICDAGGNSVFRLSESASGLQYWARAIGTFWIEPDGARIWYRPAAGARDADIEHVISGPVLGLAFQSQGQTLLHAGAVAIDGHAAGFMAPHGFGKSTLAASFARSGHALITDDVLPLGEREGRITARQGVPRIKLWGDALVALGDDEDQYEVVLTGADKRRIPLNHRWGKPAPAELPLTALYLLEPHTDPARPIICTDLDPIQAVLSVLGNTYMADSLRGARAIRALDAATRIASAVPVRSIAYYRSFDTLPALHEAIRADMRQHRRRHD